MAMSKSTKIITLLVVDAAFFLLELITGMYCTSNPASWLPVHEGATRKMRKTNKQKKRIQADESVQETALLTIMLSLC